jgi:flagellar protein FlgJ
VEAGDIQAASGGMQAPGAARTMSEAAEQFEALFVHMMLKSMRSAGPESGLLEGRSGGTYQDLFDWRIAQDIAGSNRLGLAEMLVRQLGDARAGEGGKDGMAAMPARPGAEPAGAPQANATGASVPSDPAAFTAALRPHAERAGARLGVSPDVLIAQAALETGWGEGMIRHADGRPSFNVFNIKAGTAWSGERVARETLEYVDGSPRRLQAEFRAYPSLAAAFDDYVELIERSPRYRDALAAGDAEGYVRALQRGGYATDPVYADKVLAVLDSGPLGQSGGAFSPAAHRPIT